jgi:hypothetical protein
VSQADPNEEWIKGYEKGHKEGYEAGLAAAQPLATDLLALRVPCSASMLGAVLKAFSRSYPKGTMRQMGQWVRFAADDSAGDVVGKAEESKTKN